MSLVFIGLGVLLLLLLMVVFKLNAFISLIIVSLIVAVLEGMSPLEAIASVEKGLGSTLGHLALVLGFGAMLGKLMADSGGAQRIAMTLIDRFGIGKIQWATMLTGFVIGIALFYETGFIILIPLVFTIAQAARLPVLLWECRSSLHSLQHMASSLLTQGRQLLPMYFKPIWDKPYWLELF